LDKNKKILTFLKSSFQKANKEHLFIRIPKTGGNSMQRAINENWGHYTAAFCKSVIPQKDWNNAFKFTIVRNPYDWLVSWYHYNIRKTPYKNMTFNEWVLADYPHHLHADYERKVQPANPVSQLDWIVDENGKILVDYVGKLENLEVEIEEICKRIGVKYRKIQQLNKSNREDYTGYYNSLIREKVEKDYSRELQAFNYQYGK
jgi:hypothetical protein